MRNDLGCLSEMRKTSYRRPRENSFDLITVHEKQLRNQSDLLYVIFLFLLDEPYALAANIHYLNLTIIIYNCCSLYFPRQQAKISNKINTKENCVKTRLVLKTHSCGEPHT